MCTAGGCGGCYEQSAMAYAAQHGLRAEADYPYHSDKDLKMVSQTFLEINFFSKSKYVSSIFRSISSNQGSCANAGAGGSIKPSGVVVVASNNEELMRRAVAKYGFVCQSLCVSI